MSVELIKGIELAYAERSDLLVLALTGRTGSGCSTTANVFCSEYSNISLAIDSLEGLEARKIGIVNDFARIKWQPFRKITVSTVILSYVVAVEWGALEGFLITKKVKPTIIHSLGAMHQALRENTRYQRFIECVTEPVKDKYPDAWQYYCDALEPAGKEVKNILANFYAPIFQSFGDNLRFSGNPISDQVDPNSLFSLIRRVKILAKAAFYEGRSVGRGSTKIVIDAIRNPLELVYLRDQFAAFYAIAITAENTHRVARLMNSGLYTSKDIDAIDAKEYSKKSLDKYESFVSQNIKECIQKSDLFFTNPGDSREFEQSVDLNRQIVKYVALMLRPGLITPTRDERCMQLAFSAKLNSGCISRQVGAAVADKNYSIKSVGWNDVPKGQISCLLRSVNSLLSNNDAVAFSDYEKNDKQLREHLGSKFSNRGPLESVDGLKCPFCFKDAYNTIKGEKNQVHTRSLHAEENAFLQLVKTPGDGIDGGALYTTASPCELCSKKAFQLGIKEIIYVDPYPGISAPHILSSGEISLRPTLRLFSGAVGHAYHRLYDPLLPIKDEYQVRLRVCKLNCVTAL
jgi:deoxycytidylate deaminase